MGADAAAANTFIVDTAATPDRPEREPARGLNVDQRNLTRPAGPLADIGAVERQVVQDVIFGDRFERP